MFSVLALYPNMAQQILEELQVEPILAELQQKRVATTAGASSVRALSTSDDGDSITRASMITTNTNLGEEAEKPVLVTQRKSKTDLWNELKIMSTSFSCVMVDVGLVRTLTLIYSLSALVLLSRIQFNLLGRQAYIASILALAPESTSGSNPAVQQIRLREETGLGDLELQRSFLSFSWWLVHRGWKSILTRVQSAVEEVFASYKLLYNNLIVASLRKMLCLPTHYGFFSLKCGNKSISTRPFLTLDLTRSYHHYFRSLLWMN